MSRAVTVQFDPTTMDGVVYPIVSSLAEIINFLESEAVNGPKAGMGDIGIVEWSSSTNIAIDEGLVYVTLLKNLRPNLCGLWMSWTSLGCEHLGKKAEALGAEAKVRLGSSFGQKVIDLKKNFRQWKKLRMDHSWLNSIEEEIFKWSGFNKLLEAQNPNYWWD
ncbi:hypothetical protein BD410DRAFT_810413 [Rickenella mellea]|uniref:Uncharacterized protein n=1 Tax=Rickenella mellea TaxID=50990 RepID=A0A4Y7PEC3_9AGAM|nr:hypothetical protein BD410DRAFT_810413 [Rickenella mellea]